MWFWRTLKKIIWIDPVINEELRRVKEERNILHALKKRRKTKWIGVTSCVGTAF
jgi:hypothetical protein